jgi:protein MpaA
MQFNDLKSGLSVEGEEINAYKSDLKAKHYFYLMAGVHGDEVEGVYLLKELFEWLKQMDDAQLQLPLIVLPILNVDGYRAGTRVNAHGVDLNRNLPSNQWTSEARDKKYYPGPNALSEPENQFLVKLFDKYPPSFILSLHSWKPMLNYNGKDCRKFADLMHQYNKYEVVADIEGHPTPGSLGEFGPERYGAQVLTFEAPLISNEISLKSIWMENEQALKALLLSDVLKNHSMV